MWLLNEWTQLDKKSDLLITKAYYALNNKEIGNISQIPVKVKIVLLCHRDIWQIYFPWPLSTLIVWCTNSNIQYTIYDYCCYQNFIQLSSDNCHGSVCNYLDLYNLMLYIGHIVYNLLISGCVSFYLWPYR